MEIVEIENMSYTKLREWQAQLVTAAQALDPAEVARRYVQARGDAKQRDEKLAQQGRTISSLEEDAVQRGRTIVSLSAGLHTASTEFAAMVDKCDTLLTVQAEMARAKQQVDDELVSQRDKVSAELTQLRADKKAVALQLKAEHKTSAQLRQEIERRDAAEAAAAAAEAAKSAPKLIVS